MDEERATPALSVEDWCTGGNDKDVIDATEEGDDDGKGDEAGKRGADEGPDLTDDEADDWLKDLIDGKDPPIFIRPTLPQESPHLYCWKVTLTDGRQYYTGCFWVY